MQEMNAIALFAMINMLFYEQQIIITAHTHEY